MVPEKRRKIAKFLSLAVIITGILVIIGWVFDITVLKSISPAWTSMKFVTAFAFILSGITLYFIVRALEGEFDQAQIVLSVTSFTITLLMGVLFFSALFGIRTGLEDLFIKEPSGTIKTVAPGRPSIPTMVNFLLIAAAGIQVTWNSKNLRNKLTVLGIIIAAVGALAIVGYITGSPHLYYFFEGKNTAIACNTAVLFVLLGIGLLCLNEK